MCTHKESKSALEVQTNTNNKLDFNYQTSKDYNKLFKLVKSQRVICIVTYKSRSSSNEIRDICASGTSAKMNRVDISCRGTSYITAFPFDDNTVKEEFILQCEHYKLEYIIPNIEK